MVLLSSSISDGVRWYYFSLTNESFTAPLRRILSNEIREKNEEKMKVEEKKKYAKNAPQTRRRAS